MFKLKKRVSFDCDELIQNDLTCPICSEIYDRSDRLPKLLNRCHSICLRCLKGICSRPEATSRQSFLCPICRRDINIPKGGPSRFQTDPFLNGVLNRIENWEVTPECPKHPLEELQYCEPCDALFCDSCDNKSHCNEDPASPVHFTKGFSSVMKGKSKHLIDQADKWWYKLDAADKTLAFVEEKIKENSDGALEENDIFFTRMYSLLDKRRQEVSASIRRARDAKLKALHNQRQWITNEKAEVLAGFKKFKHQGAISEVNRKTEELRMREEKNKNCLNPRANSSFHYDEKTMEAQTFQRAIRGFGGFRTSQTLPSLCRAKVGKCFARMCTSVTIVTHHFSGNNYWGNDLKAISATLSDSGKYESNLSKIIDAGGGTYEVQFVPLKLGTHQLRVTIFGCPIKDYPLEFQVESYENPYYTNEIGDTCKRSSMCTSPDTQCVKLIVNQKEVKIGPLGWSLGVESAVPLKPNCCGLLDTTCRLKTLCAATSGCSETTWICGGDSICRLDSKGEIECWVSKVVSSSENLTCIESVPGCDLSSSCSKVDIIGTTLQTTNCSLKQGISIDEAWSEATFRYKIENFTGMKGYAKSPPSYVRKLSWSIIARERKYQSEPFKTLGFFLECGGYPVSSSWSCNVWAHLRLINQNGGKPFERRFDHIFDGDEPDWGFPKFIPWKDIIDSGNGYIKDNSIILEVWMSAGIPNGISDSIEYPGYLPLKKQASTSASLFVSPSSNRTGLAKGKNGSPLNQNSCQMSTPKQETSTNTSDEWGKNSNQRASSISRSFRSLWIGSDGRAIHVVSAEDQSEYNCVKIKLPASALQILHVRDKVYISLANGLCCVFTGYQNTQYWNFSEYFLVNIRGTSQKMGNRSRTDEPESSENLISLADEYQQDLGISCMEAVKTSIWLAHQNSIYILDCKTLRINSQFTINSGEAQIGKMTATEGGVWCSYRSQSDQMIQLFSAIEPYEKVISIDIRPDLKKMLFPVLSDCELDSLARITALKASNGHLWVGTAAGVILCIPYKLTSNPTEPKCDLSQAQLSLHGFGGAVKFFLLLKDGMISGGQGYRDLMIDSSAGTNCIFDQNYPNVILWEKNE